MILLMRIMTENNAIIQRYYWTSKFSGEIEYINPLIYDAYDFHIDFIGSRPDLKICLEIYFFFSLSSLFCVAKIRKKNEN